jgi:RNA polymerase sigma-70 factor (ECF subfamily)
MQVAAVVRSPSPTPDRSAVLEQHGPAVWSLCRRLGPDPEDAYQEIWEKVFRALAGFDPNGTATLRTWILTVAHRHLVDRSRRRKVRGHVVELPDIPDREPAVEESLADAQRVARLEAALGRLPETARRVVVMHHLHDRPLDEIALSEGVAVGTVKSRLHRARAQLLGWLGGRDE